MSDAIKKGLIVLILCAPFGSAFADPADGACDVLSDGASPGLFGLCVAFHNADEEARERILRNYRRKMQEGDPDMPGTVICPCWDLEFAQGLTAGETVSFCGTFGTSVVTNTIFYNSGLQFNAVEFGGMFFCSVGSFSSATNTGQHQECVDVLAALEPDCVFD